MTLIVCMFFFLYYRHCHIGLCAINHRKSHACIPRFRGSHFMYTTMSYESIWKCRMKVPIWIKAYIRYAGCEVILLFFICIWKYVYCWHLDNFCVLWEWTSILPSFFDYMLMADIDYIQLIILLKLFYKCMWILLHKLYQY